MRYHRNLRHQHLGILGSFYLLDTGAVLDFNLCSRISAVSGSLGWQDRFVIVFAGRRLGRLNMSQRCVAHTVGAAEQTVLAQTHSNEEVLFRQNDRCVLEIVRALCI